MENIIKSVVNCGSWYGIVALAIIAVCFIVAVVYANKIIRFVFPYLHKDLYKICNTLVKYEDVQTKACVKDVSFETELHR